MAHSKYKKINLSQFKEGYEVQIAHGDWFQVKDHNGPEDTILGAGLKVEGIPLGMLAAHGLITAIKPNFEWKDARPGMAFLWDVDEVVYYVGPDPFTEDAVYVTVGEDTADAKYKHELTRHPEADLKV